MTDSLSRLTAALAGRYTIECELGAFEWIERSIDWGFCNYRYLEEYNPFFKPLHGNPRFQELVTKARRKHEAFDA
jgi:hypothetical protein